MISDLADQHRESIVEEIRLIILEALRNEEPIHPDILAGILASSYPRSGLTEAHISAGLAAAASEVGVDIQPSQAEMLRIMLKRAQSGSRPIGSV